MIVTDISNISKNSDVYINVECDIKCSEKCVKIKEEKYKTVLYNLEKNENNYVCEECKYYKVLNNYKSYFDEKYFDKIDNKEKSYLLGLVLNNIKKYNSKKNEEEYYIELNNLNIKIINLFYYISEDITINNEDISFIIKSKNIIKDINKHLNIKKLSDIIINNNYNYLLNSISDIEIQLAFIRAYIEKNINLDINNEKLECKISDYSKENILTVVNLLNIPHNIDSIFNIYNLYYNDVNIIDMLGKLYKNHDGLIKDKLYNKYIYILNNQKELPLCKILKVDTNAIMPSKTRESDVGYDLTIIKEVKKFNNNTILYDTGIKLYINNGYYVEIVPRSSISKSGYMLANSIGIIDQSYRGNLMVALTKIDETSEDIKLPFKCCQLIFRKQLYVDMIEVIDNFEETNRNEGGYGSTSK